MNCNSFAKFTLVSFFLLMVLAGLSIADDPPIACFTTDVQTGDIPLLVTFDDASIGEIAYWTWNFGDGTELLYLYEDGDTQHTYTSYDTFNVTMTAYVDEYTYSSATTQIVTYAPLVAGFTHVSTPGTFPLEVQFNDESTGDIVSWEWDFGDESAISYEQNPTHTYTTAGNFTVTLTVTDSGDDTSEAEGDVAAQEPWSTDGNGAVYGSNASGSWKIALLTVGFESEEAGKWHVIHRDLAQTPYTTNPFNLPQWQDNTKLAAAPEDWPDGDANDYVIQSPTPQPSKDVKYPICYTCNSHMKVKLTVKIQGSPNIEFYQGYQPDENFNPSEDPDTTEDYTSSGYNFPQEAYDPDNPNSIILDCSKAFDDGLVQYFENLKIRWLVKIDGRWGNLTCSENQCYVTLTDPIQSDNYKPKPGDPNANWILDTSDPLKLFHTCIHHACETSNGKSDTGEIITSIWTVFSNKNVFRAEDKFQKHPPVDMKLKFYSDWENKNYLVQQMLADSIGDGQCGAWVTLFLDTLQVHGITSTQNLIAVSKFINGINMAIKDWDFNYTIPTPPATNPHEIESGFPYINVKRGANWGKNVYTWTHQDVEDDTSGKAGQQVTNPKSLFFIHYIVKMNNKYYDPSYGTSYDSTTAWENDNLKATVKFVLDSSYEESVAGIDITNDGDTDDIVPNVHVDSFALDEEGEDLTYQATDY